MQTICHLSEKNLVGLKTWVFSLFVLMPPLAFGQASTQPALSVSLSPETVIQRIHAAAQTISFSGTYIHEHDSTIHSLKIYQVRDASGLRTRVVALEGRRQEIVRSPEGTRVYLPEQQQVRIDRATPARPAFPGMFLGASEHVLRHYELQFGKPSRVADIDVVEVLLKPKDQLRWPVRLWADPRSGLMMKCQKLDFDGKVIEQAAFSELNFKANVSVSMVQPSFEGHESWKQRHGDMVAVDPKPRLKYKPETLEGFELVGVYQREAETPGQSFKIRQYVLTDGVATVSVFVQPKEELNPLKDRVSRRGALSMLARPIQDAWVTVMGEVPPETLRNFSQSLEWKATP